MSDSAEYLAHLYEGLGSLQNDFRNYNLLRFIADRIRGERVLDIGCGSGGLLSLLRQQGHQVRGIEPNVELVGLANRLHPELSIVQGTGADLSRMTGQFDAITLIDVLEHIEDDCQQLRLIQERLVPGGQFLVLVPAFPMLYGQRDRNNGHYRRYTSEELIGKLCDSGFEQCRHRYWNALGFFPYFIFERILHRELNTELRNSRPQSWWRRILIRGLHTWFREVENRASLGFGLSLLCDATKPLVEAEAPPVILKHPSLIVPAPPTFDRQRRAA